MDTLIGLRLGQFLSLLITTTDFTSSELAKKGKISVNSKENFLVVKENEYTVLTSVMLLDC